MRFVCMVSLIIALCMHVLSIYYSLLFIYIQEKCPPKGGRCSLSKSCKTENQRCHRKGFVSDVVIFCVVDDGVALRRGVIESLLATGKHAYRELRLLCIKQSLHRPSVFPPFLEA
jgi:hypothetical protein